MATMKDILERVASGTLPIAEAANLLHERDLGYARVDTDRLRRCGLPEVIYCPGKTCEQIVGIAREMLSAGQPVFATRISPDQAAAFLAAFPEAAHHRDARAVTLDTSPAPPPVGLVAIVCAGTSDIPVASEAALTAERIGARVERFYDVGVAGLHRLLRHIPRLREARAVVVAAGMEGALPSVVGGLLDVPIVAVPTSIGYGVSFNGLAAMLAMLNSCVAGISVVNIDNGFGAGVAAAMINRMAERATGAGPANRREPEASDCEAAGETGDTNAPGSALE